MELKGTLTQPNEEYISYVIDDMVDIVDGQYGIYKKVGKNYVFKPKGTAVYVDEILNQIDTGQKSLVLYFYDAQGREVEVRFPRKELTEQGIMSLLGLGAQVTKQDARTLIMSIINQEPDVPCKLFHKKLGFWIYDNKRVFLGARGIGVESEYTGDLQVNSNGEFSEWMKMVKDEILGHIPMEFMLAVGGSSILVDYLREDINIENIIVHLIGESSSGKSTAGMFMVSCGAKPSFQGDSLIMNFSDTLNSILAKIQSAYPVLIDEGSLCRYNPTSFLYSLAMGKEKSRLTKELDAAESSHFNTAIGITSEKSLLGISDENTGLRVRNFEIRDIEWTKSAKSADIIKNTIQHHYGFLIPKLALRIVKADVKGGRQNLIKRYWKWYDRLVDDARKDGYYNPLTERASKQSAIILLSAELIQKVLKIELNVEGILKLLEEHSLVRDPENADISRRAFEYLLQYVSRYYSQFYRGGQYETVPSDCKGCIKSHAEKTLQSGEKSSITLYILDSIFEEILREGNFPDKKIILKKWKAQGYLKSEKDRYLSDITIAPGIRAKGYIIRVPGKTNLNK